MRKLNQILSVILILIVITSCSNSQENINDNWWISHEDNYTNEIIRFTKDNKLQCLNKENQEYKYKIVDTKIQLLENNEYKDVFDIVSITDSLLFFKQNNGNEEFKYRIADESDFFLGEWEGTINNEKIELNFNYSTEKGYTEWYVEENGNKSKIEFWANGGPAVFYNEDFDYAFSVDKNTLTLKGDNNTYNLKRSSSLPNFEEKKRLKEEKIEKEMAEAYRADSLKSIIDGLENSLDKLLELNFKSSNNVIELFTEMYSKNSIQTFYNEYEDIEDTVLTTRLYYDSYQEVLLLWGDYNNGNYKNLKRITVNNENSFWKTSDGVKIGLTLQELEKINTKPFTFYGFDMDAIPVGSVDDFQGGKLNSKKIQIEFNHTSALSGIGYEPIMSNTDIAKESNPIIGSISLIVKQ